MRTLAKPSTKNHLIEMPTNFLLSIWSILKYQSTLPKISTVIYNPQRRRRYIKGELTESIISKGLYDEKNVKHIRITTQSTSDINMRNKTNIYMRSYHTTILNLISRQPFSKSKLEIKQVMSKRMRNSMNQIGWIVVSFNSKLNEKI
jgi:hypothetical protein